MNNHAQDNITAENSVKIVQEFYDKSVSYEWERIVDRPEFLLTCRMLDRYIKPGDTVLDIGGGPGRYSFYLAEKGCDVTLFDLSAENVNHVNKRSLETGVAVRAINGDAREVEAVLREQLSDSSQLFDHVLLMGPLYHLLDENDRIKAVNAALKLLKPGGLLFAAFISMSGGLVFMLRELPEQFANPDEERFLVPLVAGENYAGRAFTQAFFINQSEVLPFMEQFPLKKLHLFGQEGVLAPNEHKFMEQTPEVKEALLDIAEKLFEKEEYLSWSEHLMYVGRRT
ncbi:MAG: class I SAM-dependent methyltransferase [Oscillospiraceae bacterium]|nr:class I SAM-dependent methyltransferase [Oscillospiraceae bacterium]